MEGTVYARRREQKGKSIKFNRCLRRFFLQFTFFESFVYFGNFEGIYKKGGELYRKW
ncbi:hypothetical protein AusDCA_3426 [Desulfitobacterium sp. AusDCA]